MMQKYTSQIQIGTSGPLFFQPCKEIVFQKYVISSYNNLGQINIFV